jgi:hypothetical protein
MSSTQQMKKTVSIRKNPVKTLSALTSGMNPDSRTSDVNFFIPCARGLFQTVEDCLQLAYKTLRVELLSGKTHVSVFIQDSIEKCTFDIDLVDQPFRRGCRGKQSANHCEICYWCVRLVVVNLWTLKVPKEDQTRLVTINTPVRSTLHLEYTS